MRKQVAAGLADAMLAGPPLAAGVLARCAEALDTAPPWLPSLVRSMLRKFRAAWHWGSRRELTAAILGSDFFANAWLSQPHPRIVRPCLVPPAMAPRPLFPQCALPDLPDAAALALWLAQDDATLEAILRSLDYRDAPEQRRLRHYRYRWVAKRRGGFRLLEIPKLRLRGLQRRILRGLLEYLPPHEAAHGFRVGHSPLTHAREHTGQAVVIRMDLADFFLHVRAARVRALFRYLGYPDGVADRLTALCTARVPGEILAAANGRAGDPRRIQLYRSPHLPQGAPTSPALANLGAFRLDLRLRAAAEAAGAHYTRYADDLAFSGGRDFARGAERFIPLVGAIAADEGFAVNFRKTRVMRRGLRQEVAGVVVNERPNLARDDYDRLKAILHNCLKHGPETQSELPPAEFRAKLAGHVAHLAGINAQRAAKLKTMLAAIRWEAP